VSQRGLGVWIYGGLHLFSQFLCASFANAQTCDKVSSAEKAAAVRKADKLDCSGLEKIAELCSDASGSQINLAECYEKKANICPDASGANMAECYEKYGRTAVAAKAWRRFERAAELLSKPTANLTPVDKKIRVQKAREGQKRIRKRVALLTIFVPSHIRTISGLSIKVEAASISDKVTFDASSISDGQWKQRIAIDADRVYSITASASGKREWVTSVKIPPGNEETISIPKHEDPPPKLKLMVANEMLSLSGLKIAVDNDIVDLNELDNITLNEADEHKVVVEAYCKKVTLLRLPAVPPGKELSIDVPKLEDKPPELLIDSSAVRNLPELVLRLERNAREIVIPVESWKEGVPLELEPVGDYVLIIKAKGKKSWSWKKRVAISDGCQQFRVAIPALAPESPSLPPPPPPSGFTVRQVLWGGGLGLVGAGAITLSVASGLGIQALIKNSESNSDGHCDDNDVCDEVGFELREEALTWAKRSNGPLIAGCTALALGGGLLITWKLTESPSARSKPSGNAARGRLTLGPSSVSFQGSW
jgi:hypothetical protein